MASHCQSGVTSPRLTNILRPAIAEWAAKVHLKPLAVSNGDRLLHGPYAPIRELEAEEEPRVVRGGKWGSRPASSPRYEERA